MLHYAAQAQSADAVIVALEAGANVLARSNVMRPRADDETKEPAREDLRGGLTPIMAAAAASSVESLTALLDAAENGAPKRETFLEMALNAVDASRGAAIGGAISIAMIACS